MKSMETKIKKLDGATDMFAHFILFVTGIYTTQHNIGFILYISIYCELLNRSVSIGSNGRYQGEKKQYTTHT